MGHLMRTDSARGHQNEYTRTASGAKFQFLFKTLEPLCESGGVKLKDGDLMYIVHSSARTNRHRWIIGDVKNINCEEVNISGITGKVDLLMSSRWRWLLIYEYSDRRMFQYNPISTIKILIPPFPIPWSGFDHKDFRYLLTMSPSETQWSLICISRKLLRYLVFHPAEKPSLNEYSLPDVYRYDERTMAEVCYKGKMFINGSTMLMIDILGDPVSTDYVVKSDVEVRQSLDFITELVATDDELFKVQINQYHYSKVIHSVVVYQFVDKDWNWEEINDIGDRSFFIGDLSSSFSYSADLVGSRRNCIYLTEKTQFRRVLCYSLDDRSLTFPQQNILNFYQSLCQWVPMGWQMQPHQRGNPNPRLATRFNYLIEESMPIPCLLYSRTNDGVYYIVESCEQKVYTVDIPELAKCILYSYEDGWFIVHKPPIEIFFFNIFTRQKFVLPPKRKPLNAEEWALYGLSFSAPPPASVVLAIEESPTKLGCVIFTHKFGENFWTRSSFGVEDKESFRPNYNRPIVEQEVFNLLGRYAEIGLFNPTTCDWQVTKICEDDKNNDWPFTRDSYFVRQGDRLLAIFMDEADYPCGIYEIRRNGKWKEVNDFRDECLYLGRYTSLFAPTLDKRRKNAICLNKFKDDGFTQFVETYPFDDGEIETSKNQRQKTVYFSCNSWIALPKSVLENNKNGHLSLQPVSARR